MKHGQLSGESSHCGQCGLPGSMCQCSQYKEWGAEGATKAGSETGDDPNQMKNGNNSGNGNGNGGNSNPGNGGEKKEGGGGSFGGGGASGSY